VANALAYFVRSAIAEEKKFEATFPGLKSCQSRWRFLRYKSPFDADEEVLDLSQTPGDNVIKLFTTVIY
jgi:hypothetical protein